MKQLLDIDTVKVLGTIFGINILDFLDFFNPYFNFMMLSGGAIYVWIKICGHLKCKKKCKNKKCKIFWRKIICYFKKKDT